MRIEELEAEHAQQHEQLRTMAERIADLEEMVVKKEEKIKHLEEEIKQLCAERLGILT